LSNVSVPNRGSASEYGGRSLFVSVVAAAGSAASVGAVVAVDEGGDTKDDTDDDDADSDDDDADDADGVNSGSRRNDVDSDGDDGGERATRGDDKTIEEDRGSDAISRLWARSPRCATKSTFFFSNAAGIKGDASATEPHPRGARCDRPLGRNPEISEMFAAADLRLHLRRLGCFTAGKLN
jgi:hypothetical protein